MAKPEVRRCGAVGRADGSACFRVWAPNADAVELVLHEDARGRAVAMAPEPHGYFRHDEPAVPDGRRYGFRLDGGPERPDPYSLWQPEGVHGPSAVVRPERFGWAARDWAGVRRHDLVLYELHVGTFTPEGTFDAVIPRLAELKELGVTAVELMPVGQFPGTRNWGYDGVFPFAAQDSYGGPHGLQRLIDAAHAAGLAVFLDVVYNHLGPEGNYLAEFGPYFTDRYQTPWGRAVNFDGPGSDAVRQFVVDNARMWLSEFRLDGLRLDAVHAMFDQRATHILREIREGADGVAAQRGCPAYLIAESDLNDPRLLHPPQRGGYGLDGQWSDDFHHAVHALLTGERHGYYADFGEARQLAAALERPFVYAGQFSPFRGRRHGAPADGLPGDRFVVCLQNHDQVGNRARGDRLATLLGRPEKNRLAASLLLLSPYVPLLFMGEEYGEESPFPFFCSFGDEPLVQAVRDGRRQEFAAFDWQGELPDPHAAATFAAARPGWDWPDGSPRAGLRRLYRDLLAARRAWPALHDFERRTVRLFSDPDAGPILELNRGAGPDQLRIAFNLGDRPATFPAQGRLMFSSEWPAYGGSRHDDDPVGELRPFECQLIGP